MVLPQREKIEDQGRAHKVAQNARGRAKGGYDNCNEEVATSALKETVVPKAGNLEETQFIRCKNDW